MTKTDQEALQEYGRDIGQTVIPTVHEGLLAVNIGAMTTTNCDRAYMALRSLEGVR